VSSDLVTSSKILYNRCHLITDARKSAVGWDTMIIGLLDCVGTLCIHSTRLSITDGFERLLNQIRSGMENNENEW
jgi:hypothetical protein